MSQNKKLLTSKNNLRWGFSSKKYFNSSIFICSSRSIVA